MKHCDEKTLSNYQPPSNELIEAVIRKLSFNDDGLIPTIAQQFDTKEILMMAWMNVEAVRQTLKKGITHYWSRSRSCLWQKGETSGHIQLLKELRWDCDCDAMLVMIDQVGVACHTGRDSCFFNALQGGNIAQIMEVAVDLTDIYDNNDVRPKYKP